jgi:hypothetical protein
MEAVPLAQMWMEKSAKRELSLPGRTPQDVGFRPSIYRPSSRLRFLIGPDGGPGATLHIRISSLSRPPAPGVFCLFCHGGIAPERILPLCTQKCMFSLAVPIARVFLSSRLEQQPISRTPQ